MSKKNIESIYPLSPLQNALLLHRVTSGAEDTGFLQVRFSLCGDLDVPALKAAWQQVVKRHAALRMTVQSTDQQKPLLVVWRTVEIPWATEDWRNVPESEQPSRLDAYCSQDRQAGLNLSKPPAMRVALIQLEDKRHHVIWSCHHVLLDGWSAAVVLRDVFSIYHGSLRGEHVRLPPVSALGEYYRWHKKRNNAHTEVYWRDRLQGFVAPTPIGTPAAADTTSTARRKLAEQSATLTPRIGSQIDSLVKSRQLTPNAIVQGAWALLLSRLSNTTDIVFGAAVSGRSFDLTGGESMVGLFANVVPVRTQIDATRLVIDWLQSLRDDQFRVQAHEHASLVDIEAWSDVPGNRLLFDSLVLVQNIPWEDFNRDANGSLELHDYRTGITSNYPLTLVVTPGATWSIRCSFETDRFTAGIAAAILDTFCMLLNELVAGEQQPLSHLLEWLESAPPLADFHDIHATSDGQAALAASCKTASQHVAPRNHCELELVKIWEETLDRRPIGVQDDFFALGGRSLAAVRMIARVEEQFQKQLQVATLWENPTIERLASILQEDQELSDWTSLVPIQTGGTQPPLFFIHAGGVHALFYGSVARHLGSDQPIYALQPPGLDGKQPPLGTLEEIAAHYIEELRSVQPRGPYFFAGHCFGAHVGFAMAQHLYAEDERVALLAVLDAWPPAFKPPTVADELNDRVSRAFGRLQQREWGRLLSSVRAGLIDYSRRLYRSIVRFGERIRRPCGRWWVCCFGSAESRRMLYMQEVDEACLKAASLYVPRPYAGTVTVIRTADTANVYWQWREIAADFVCHEMPGGHRTIFEEPHVEQLAKLLSRCIESARETQNVPAVKV